MNEPTKHQETVVGKFFCYQNSECQEMHCMVSYI